jgi:hypothetical protein
LRIRLLDESVDGERGAAVELCAWTNVAVAGRGVGRGDAESYNQARRGGRCRFPAGVFQSLGVAHNVIGGKDEDTRVWPPLARQLRGDSDRHGGIAARRLQDNVGFDIALAQLLGRDETKIGMGDDDRPIK